MDRFARRPDDGAAIWAYQWEPHDEYDYDGINETILLDLEIDGQTRRVLVRPERNGHIYVMDRTSGEVLSAEPYVHVTVTKGVDLKTGRPIKVEEKKTGSAGWSATSARPLPAGKIGNPRLIP
jgi:glucose dehydrogenase